MKNYFLKNNILQISVNSLGAELNSIKTNDGVELVWQAKKEIWPRYSPILFPIVGRLKSGSYLINGAEYQLPQHGFARDMEFELIEQTDNQLSFELTAYEESLRIYPFHFSLIVSYRLIDNEVNVIYKVFNPDNHDLLFSIGAHPGFSTQRIASETINDYYLEFENISELRVEKLKDGLLSGDSYSIPLVNNSLNLHTSLFENDALVFKNKQIDKISLCSRISKQKIELSCKDWPYFSIWTKKDTNSFICLEPWYGITDTLTSDHQFQNKDGLVQLSSLKTFETSFSIKITQ